MEVAWRFRIIFVMAFVVIIFGDLLGYGGARKEPKDKSLLTGITEVETSSAEMITSGKDAPSTRPRPTSHTNGQCGVSAHARTTIPCVATVLTITDYSVTFDFLAAIGSVESDFDEDTTGLSTAELAARKEKLKNSLREACLPKLLCEMAAKPNYSLNARERDLLSLMR